VANGRNGAYDLEGEGERAGGGEGERGREGEGSVERRAEREWGD